MSTQGEHKTKPEPSWTEIKSQHWMKLAEIAGQLSSAAIRGVILINGGAALAVLAFVGQLAVNGQNQPAIMTDLGTSVAIFGVGAVCGVLTAMIGWYAQMLYLNSMFKDDKGLAAGHAVRLLSLVALSAGVGLFLYGLYYATAAFKVLNAGN